MSDPGLDAYVRHMGVAKMSPATVKSRVRCLRALLAFLGDTPLLEATAVQLEDFQATYADRAPATVDIYTRHVRAFYAWALDFDRIVIDPSRRMVLPRLGRAVPHPVKPAVLRAMLAYVRPSDPLRMAYVLAAFAGLRCGEICRLEWEHCNLEGPNPNALIHGKGNVERIVPLIPAVVDELERMPGDHRGHVVLNRVGRPYKPDLLSIHSHRLITELGLSTTLHSLRHYFATEAAQLTRDPLFVRDLLGHASVATTERYMGTSLVGAHGRLAELSASAAGMLTNTVGG